MIHPTRTLPPRGSTPSSPCFSPSRRAASIPRTRAARHLRASVAALALRGAVVLGASDWAVLDRLRAIALLFRAADRLLPVLYGIHIGLFFTEDFALRLFAYLDPTACQLIADTAGWHNLPLELGQVGRSPAFFERVAQAELPDGCPPGLASLLMAIPHSLCATTAARLADAGWHIEPAGRIEPVLPDQISAHEALEILVDAEGCGGLGRGPLAALARQAVAQLAGGPRP